MNKFEKGLLMTKNTEFTIETKLNIPFYTMEINKEDIFNFLQNLKKSMDNKTLNCFDFCQSVRCVEIKTNKNVYHFSNFFVFCNENALIEESKQWRFFLANHPRFNKTYLKNAKRFFDAIKTKKENLSC